MPITTQQQTQLYSRPRAVPQQSPTQESPLLTKLPRELRDMIYEQVFAGESEIMMPHPLMRTSKQMREEVAEAAARYVGPRARLSLIPLNRTLVDTEIEMEDPDHPSRYIPIRMYKDRVLLLYGLGTKWHKFCCNHFGKRLLPYIRQVRIYMRMADIDTITIKFKEDSAPEIIAKAGLYYRVRHPRSAEFYELFQSIAEKHRKEKVECSVEWVNAFMKDTLDAREKIRLRLENRERVRWV